MENTSLNNTDSYVPATKQAGGELSHDYKFMCSPFLLYFPTVLNVSEKSTPQLPQNWRKMVISKDWFSHVFFTNFYVFHSNEVIRFSSFQARLFLPCEGTYGSQQTGQGCLLRWPDFQALADIIATKPKGSFLDKEIVAGYGIVGTRI